MLVRRYLLGSSVVMLLAACAAEKLPLGEADGGVDGNDSGAGAGGTDGASGAGGTDGASGQVGSGGSAGSGGGTPSACQPTAEICYGNRPASSAGSECLANVDNRGAPRVQFRQTWISDVAPAALTSPTLRSIRTQYTSLNLAACHAVGNGGQILISSWDRSNPDLTQQTLTSGFASYRARGPTPSSLIDEGLCFGEWSFSYAGPDQSTSVSIGRWSDLTDAQPWHLAPTVYRRTATDFTAADLFDGTASGESRVFIDEASGHIHAFTPRRMMSLANPAGGGFVLPMYAVETRWKFNDATFNCMGRFRSDALNPNSNCGAGAAQDEQQWGCASDAACPPGPEFGNPGNSRPGPGYTTGFHLIVDLERVFETALGQTLCVTYAGRPIQAQIAEGWAAQTPTGATCRGGPRWNPDLPDDAGLPPGDWCSRTNSPATVTCHDAYRSVSYSSAQAFKVQDGTCTVQ